MHIYTYIYYTYIYTCYIYICSKSKSTIETLKKVVKYICSGTRLAFLLPTLNN